MLRDARFWAALAAGLAFWAALYVVLRPRLDPSWPLRSPLAFILVALVYPVLEELVFRGGLQELLQRWLGTLAYGPVSAANLVTSVVFASLHLLAHAPIWALGVFVPSLAFGFFKERYASLVPPVVLHIFYNGGYYWLFARAY